MLKTIAKKFFIDEKANCAEAVYRAAAQCYHFTTGKEDIAMVRGFGGGMGCGSTCGALAGALSALGRLYDGEKTTLTQTELSAKLVAAFSEVTGDTNCSVLKEKYFEEGQRCLKTVEIACDALEAVAAESGFGEITTTTLSAEDIKAAKGMGFLHNKGTNAFNCRVITRNGRISSVENACIAEAAKRFGNGNLAFTTRLTVEIQGVPFENIEPIRKFLATVGLETGGTGSKVRPVVACKGTTCQYGLCDTFDLSEKLHYIFYKGYRNVSLPHKFKIAVGGCPNNCVKPDLNDIGIIGQRQPILDADICRGCGKCAVEKGCPIGASQVVDGKLTIDRDICNNCGRCIAMCPFEALSGPSNGFKIVIGGRWGKKIAIGQALNHLFTTEEEVIATVEKAILLFREQGVPGERFSDTITRIGFEQVEAQLLADDLLARKDAIINEMNVVGGATC
ncbi:C-GCAxxG-C-C family (seleno)protein [Eubacterium aggregans]|uniref:C-GCAxxG-C-C family (seleno)protein n=1 Tax=Eubacterium aggregans TaxID=81409 RepID=UPI0023EFCA89|nr:C-GCAxxG-C-C family (seleno)protein [Eubacterium aggregans]MDD4691975.1 C-GCAxxG-C-C family (seleno)protein [Eubacterium aggregans]